MGLLYNGLQWSRSGTTVQWTAVVSEWDYCTMDCSGLGVGLLYNGLQWSRSGTTVQWTAAVSEWDYCTMDCSGLGVGLLYNGLQWSRSGTTVQWTAVVSVLLRRHTLQFCPSAGGSPYQELGRPKCPVADVHVCVCVCVCVRGGGVIKGRVPVEYRFINTAFLWR